MDLVVSTDQGGNIEVWDPESQELPTDGRLSFEMLSETDYYKLAVDETFALAMEFSRDWQLLAVYGRDSKIRVFHFKSGRLICTIDESLEALTRVQEDATDELVLIENPADFTAKMQGYKEAMRSWDSMDRASMPSLVFDETSSLLIYSSPIGVKTASVVTGQTIRVYGKGELGDFYL